MRTEEDEAFDDLAKKQGDWGGGFPAKRKMAADKLQEPIYNITVFDNAHPKGIPLEDWVQPAQESEILTIVYQSGYHDGKQAALVGREWNFCERCGKRTKDMPTIHTCTPPQEGK